MPRKTDGGRGQRTAAAEGFNEAAARCRGKPQDPAGDVRGGPASMRPRPDAAENRSHPDDGRRRRGWLQ